jgi:aminodeoxyfutalosine synthase
MEGVNTLDSIAERLEHGGPLTDEDAAAIFASHDLIRIGSMADQTRRRLHGARTTFVRVFEMHVDVPPAALPAGIQAGELRIVGAPASIDEACAAIEAARRLDGNTVMSGFVLSDIARLDGHAVYGRLRSAGLDRIAYAPVEWDAVASATKLARDAGLAVDRLAVVSAETPVSAALIARARELQHVLGGFRTFAPLKRNMDEWAPTTGYDDVKAVAVARMMVTDIPSIQVDWALYGPKLAQVALTMGADDIDSVAAVETGALGTRRSALEEITGNIVAAGLEPVERDGAFDVRRR